LCDAPYRGPLAGIRVAAFTHVAAGPYATLQLAYLGAEVIKVESRTRIDYWRYRDRNDDPEASRPFADHNKNVRSVTFNLKTAEGVDLARRLAVLSDVVVDNYSAGTMDRLGLGYDVLRAQRPDIIVAHMTGLGSRGPRSGYVTFGPSLMAFCGMTALWNHPDQGTPVGSQSSYPDFLSGAYAAFAILAALHRRRLTGQGDLLDLSQALVTAFAIGPTLLTLLNGAPPPVPAGNTSPTSAPYGCYPCRGGDDAWCAIAVRSDEEWTGLKQAMGRPAWADADDLRTARGRLARRAFLDACVAAWTRERTPREVMDTCQAHGVPAGIVATGEDLVCDPHLEARQFLTEGEHPRLGHLRLPGSPVRFHSQETGVWRFGPLLGEDNAYVLRTILGCSNEEIAAYTERGALL
jgi:benzylsuccinate CoA-transferase BbsF subunit